MLRRLLLGVLLLFDSYLGLSHGEGLISWSGIFTSQLKWVALSFEFMVGGLLVLRIILNQSNSKWKSITTISAPIIVITLAFVLLEFMLTGLDRIATINFNLSSVGFSGLYWSAVYLSIAIGLTLTYKVQRFANFAQAEMMLVGSYVALTLMWSDRFFPISNAPKDGIFKWELLIWAGISSFFIAGLLGLLVDRVVYRRLRARMGTPQVMMIASLGVSMVLRALLYLRFSASTFRFIPDRDWKLTTSVFEVPTQRIQLHLGDRLNDPFIALAQSVNPYGVSYSKLVLILGIFGVVVFLLILLHKTRIGRQMRAVADNPDLAATSGIHVERVHGSTAFISAGIAGFGGALLAGILPVNPELGLSLLLPAFAVIVLGTIGSVPGVIIGALIIGLLRAASEPILIGAGNALGRPTASGFAEVVPFVFLIGLLLLAPKGIGSAIEDWNIERIRGKRLQNKTNTVFVRGKSLWSTRHMSKLMAYFTVYTEHVNEKIHTIKEFLKGAMTTIWELKAISIMFALKAFNSYKPLMPSFNFISLVPPWSRIRIDRETERGSWIAFSIFFLALVCIVWLLPSVTPLTKTMQIARIVTLLGIFSLASFSLNLHTGITGMTNFGVIFFVGVGAVIVGLLCAPVETNGYGWNPWMATIVAVSISAAAGWLLAYPTARLRMDYFAIVTISLGEMLRISLQAEPLLRAGTITSAIGISQFSRPFEAWWKGSPSEFIGNLFGLHVSAPYVVLLAGLATVFVLIIWGLLNTVLSSPWGRILRSIREDEVVSQHHGHNILIHKAASLALGAGIAALAGALWAWLNTNVWPDFMNPVRTTFLIWAAFIVGGRGNNRGMIIGAFLIVIVEFMFNVLVASRGATSLPFHNITTYLDSIFSWLVINVGGIIWSSRSITEIFPRENVLLSLPHLKLALIGLVIVGALLTSSKGLLPEVPQRPKRPNKKPKSQHEESTP